MPGQRAFCGVDMSLRRLRGGVAVTVVWRSVAGGLCPPEAELAGDLVAHGAVLGSQPGDLSAGSVEPLAKRVGAGVLRDKRGRRCVLLAQLADEVPDLALAVEPASGDAGDAAGAGLPGRTAGAAGPGPGPARGRGSGAPRGAAGQAGSVGRGRGGRETGRPPPWR